MKFNMIPSVLSFGIIATAITLLTACNTFDDSTPEITAPAPVATTTTVTKSAPMQKTETAQDDTYTAPEEVSAGTHKMKIIKYHHKTTTTTNSDASTPTQDMTRDTGTQQ